MSCWHFRIQMRTYFVENTSSLRLLTLATFLRLAKNQKKWLTTAAWGNNFNWFIRRGGDLWWGQEQMFCISRQLHCWHCWHTVERVLEQDIKISSIQHLKCWNYKLTALVMDGYWWMRAEVCSKSLAINNSKLISSFRDSSGSSSRVSLGCCCPSLATKMSQFIGNNWLATNMILFFFVGIYSSNGLWLGLWDNVTITMQFWSHKYLLIS